jgi:hypothetical protein
MNKKNISNLLPKKILFVITSITVMVILMSFVLKNNNHKIYLNNEAFEKDSVASVKAFMQVFKVLVSARCVNCHPSGDVPLQGDDSHLHAMLPQRGKTGNGIYAMKCSNCHQPTNLEGLGKPPGAPHWQLPPANMKMVFQGRTAPQLAKQLVNPKTNGNKTLVQLKAHANDALVIAGWNMGGGRTAPPLPYAEFKKQWNTWIDNGAYAPKGK